MHFLIELKPYILLCYYLIVSFIIFQIIIDNKKPEKSFAYIFLILLVPVVGILLYFLLGVHYQKNKYYSRKRHYNNVLLSKKTQRNKALKNLPQLKKNKLPQLFYQNEQVNFTLDNEIEFLINGEKKFPALIKAIKKAKQNIHLEYYIINNDKISLQIIDLLCLKSKEGIIVRVIYDDVGSAITKTSIKKLKAAGVEIYPYMPVFFSRLAHKANYRSHRKIAIIDNTIGFLGGINMSDRYINPNPQNLYWRDSHIKIIGEAVQDLQYIFISDWYFVSRQEIPHKALKPKEPIKVDDSTAMCVMGSEYGDRNQSIMEAFFSMITNASKDILITTPYFLPNESILNAIKITSKSGVKIKLIIPKKPDIKTAYYASQTYLKELIECGVEVYYYTKGMIHAKTLVIDDYICTIGSTNMDYRSFNLNAEVNAFILDQEVAQTMTQQFEEDLNHCYQLNIQELTERPWHVKLICSIARLFAPVL